MVLRSRRLIAGPAVGFALGLTALLAACGAPAWNDVCNARCDSLLRCQYRTTTETNLCHSDCNNTKITASDLDMQLAKDCKNPGEIRSQQLHCFDSACLSGKDAFERAAEDCLDSAQTTLCKKP